ncbi:hypothetical protein BCR43DRAFT_491482 [Syncephalastrum racemosum]|uniref:Cation-transporting ATPase n=1 Tax=Syncephalastrum racemosum TaxID=13706 RepID=A0A1X2HC14_SYNRA|nr:hypothetical protein BCR43DRAFT_491482 [Syncephalastrum racemosum]
MSTFPSTGPLSGYGTHAPNTSNSSAPSTRPSSPASRPATPTSTTTTTRQQQHQHQQHHAKPRRDSATPLFHNPNVDSHSSPALAARDQPHFLHDLHSHPHHPHHSTARVGSALHRRRRKTLTQNNESDEEEETEEEDSDVELNTSDESNSDDTDDETTTPQQAHENGFKNDHLRIGMLAQEPNHQSLLLDEETRVTIDGYRYNRVALTVYQVGCILSCGLVWLVFRWCPHWWVRCVGERVSLRDADWLVFTNEYQEQEILRPTRELYGGTIQSVFSETQIKDEVAQHGAASDRAFDMNESLDYLTLVDYRYARLAFHPALHRFMLIGYWKGPNWIAVKNVKAGLTSEQYRQRLSVFGPNLINIREKPTTKLLRDEVLNPFYVFQIGSIILWCMDDYYYYAFCIFIISAVSIITTLIETKKTMKRMRDMSKFECTVRTFRNGAWRSVSSAELVPGDVIDIAGLQTVPCDAMLLGGDCILNESMLTGESVPVSKVPVNDSVMRKMNLSGATIASEIAKHFLFMGTRVVRVRSGSNVALATAMVVRTGFSTAKGALVRSMLFPKPNNFRFYRDSFRFIGVLAIIAVFGFIISSINFIRLGIDTTTMILRALDLITVVVPPALPATMSIGTSFAINRLKKLGIFCISPPRVNIGGKVDCMCFDKTGTLTEDGLDIHGIRPVLGELFEDETNVLEDTDPADETSESTKARIMRIMTCCHSLKIVDGELIGDPLDLKMFEYTRWELEESSGASSTGLKMTSELAASQAKKSAKVGIMPTVVRPPGGRQELSLQFDDANARSSPTEFGIIHSFEFVSALRRMSVIIRRLASPSMEVLVKGAPEVMSEICLPESLPENYQQVLYWYTHRGYRVIACASRQLDGVKWHKLHKLKRNEVESGLTFLGFIIFENKLKPRTIPSLATLREAKIRQIMCTGDNVLTAVSVSRECSLVNPAAEIYIPRFTRGSSTDPTSEIAWESVLREGSQLDGDTLEPRIGDGRDRNYYLGVTGEAFRWIIDFAPVELKHRMLVKGAIYARMSPDEKAELVSELQDIGYCVGFCGDGANDCGALKAGDIGISLSEAEASVAAPFTSNTMDIACVLDVIKEGRAALVTSFSCFKYMALYSIIQFTSITLLYAFGSNLGDFQFLYIDLFLILPIAVYMGHTGAWHQLDPKRPTASLVSKKVLTSLIGQIIITSTFQFIIYWAVQRQDWYVPPVFDPDGDNIECFENTVLFLLSSFQYILVAIVFSVGPPYRKPLWTNDRLVITLGVLIALTTWSVLWPTDWARSWLELETLPFSFRVFILFLAGTNLALCLWCEKYFFGHVAAGISIALQKARQRRQGYSSLGKMHKKIYKRVAEEMDIVDIR